MSEVDVEANADGYLISGCKVSKINESSDEMEIDMEEEQSIEAYNVKLNIDIENIVKIENIHNHHKKHWRKIYEVIQQDSFDETDNFPEEF